MRFVWSLVKAPFRLIAGGLNALRSGLSFIASKALLVKAAVVGAITTISGAIYGMIRAVTEGGGIWDVLTGALLGAAAAMTKLLNLVSLGGFDKLMAMMTGGSTASQLLGTASYGQAASDVFGVNDAIITTDGKVIQPNPDDTIIAAKPQGAIAELMRGLGLGTPQGGTSAAPNQTINVNVRIGERELKDIIKEVTSESIGAFGNV
jgi:hypothetical protein